MGRPMCITQEAADARQRARRARHVVALALIVWLVTLLGAGGGGGASDDHLQLHACAGRLLRLVPVRRDARLDRDVVQRGTSPVTRGRRGPDRRSLGDTFPRPARPWRARRRQRQRRNHPRASRSGSTRRPRSSPAASQVAARMPTAGTPARSRSSSTAATRPPVSRAAPPSPTAVRTAPTASVHGTCTDVAGNVSAPFAYGLKYDETPPSLAAVSATTGDRRVVVRWSATGGADAVEVVRSPGLKGAHASVVVRGRGVSFADTQVRNGNRYSYEVRAVDSAGNVASEDRDAPFPAAG